MDFKELNAQLNKNAWRLQSKETQTQELVEYQNILDTILRPSYSTEIEKDIEMNCTELTIYKQDDDDIGVLIINEFKSELSVDNEYYDDVISEFYTCEDLALLCEKGRKFIAKKKWDLEITDQESILQGINAIHKYLTIWRDVYETGLINYSLSEIEAVTGIYTVLSRKSLNTQLARFNPHD